MTRRPLMSIALSAAAAALTLHSPLELRAEPAANPADAKVDSFLQSAMHRHRIPGLTVAVVQSGSVILARSYGYANVEVDAATSPSSVFEIGGVSKQFTAAATMLLVEKSKLWLDAPIRLTMPELPLSWTNVTLRHLLTHTSGLPNYSSVPGFFAARRDDISRKQILDSIATLPLRFEPGTKSSVSNTDYYILGLLIERASGQGYTQFLSEQFFKPLGMSATRVNDYSRPIERRVTGYTSNDDGELIHVVPTSPTRLFASGAMVSSAADLARWQAALASGKLLKPSSVAQMWTRAKLKDGTVTNWGFGSYIRSSPQYGTVIEQVGAPAGFRSHILYFPRENTSVIVLANSDNSMSNLADHVFQIVAANISVVR